MRSPLSSRTNNRPVAPFALDFGFPFEVVVTASVIVLSCQKNWLRGRRVPRLLRGRCSPVEVRRALFQKRRKGLLSVCRANLRAELLVLGLDCRLDLFAERSLHKSLAGLQRAGRLRCYFACCFGRRSEQVLIRYDLRDQPQIRGSSGIERQSQ